MKGIKMIPICHSGQRKDQLPFPFSEFQGLQIEDEVFAELLLRTLAAHFCIPRVPPARKGTLRKQLEWAKQEIYVPDPSPQIIHSARERTQLIINDLQTLLSSTDVDQETIWSSSFLSTFAISTNDPYPLSEQDYLQLLLKEKELLCELAKRGCTIKCIISPANKNYVRHSDIDSALQRTEQLLSFIRGKERELNHIDWAISELGTKNLYIIGHMSCFEGYKQGLHQGYGLTLRQTSRDVIKANIDVYRGFFSDLAARTLAKWGNENDGSPGQRELLRLSVARYLEESIKFLKDFQNSMRKGNDITGAVSKGN